MDPSSVVPDVTQLRAITHPARLRMLGLLRLHGPSTATRLAERLGLNSGATSYHLRQLERHGFVTDDPALGDGRDRWWRATAAITSYEQGSEDPDARDAEFAFHQSVVALHVARLQRAVEESLADSPQWRRVTSSNDAEVWVTPEQAEHIKETVERAMWEALESYPSDSASAPEGARLFELQVHLFPHSAAGGADL